MNLLPMIEKKSMSLFPQAAESDKAQMTIFYAGQVIVFNDFPADKAKEIMLMASTTNKTQNPSNGLESAADAVNMVPSFGIQEKQMPSQPIVSGNDFSLLGALLIPCFSACIYPCFAFADLPIARRASLTRFLEKRKDRLTAKAPYNKEGAPKKEENKAWLGLGAHFPVKTEQY